MKYIGILLICLLLFVYCGNNTQYSDYYPTKVDIYYEVATCPWLLQKVIDTSPQLFFQGRNISYFTLDDSTSLKYFHDLKVKLDTSERTYETFDTWFSAIINYRTHIDTISVNDFQLSCGYKIIKDTSAVFYYINKICKNDSLTCSCFHEYFYDGSFQIFRNESD